MILRVITAFLGLIAGIIMLIGIIYYHANASFSDMLDMYISRYTIVLMYLMAGLFLTGSALSFLLLKKYFSQK